MIREADLPYPVDVEIEDTGGDWFFVYNQAEGFQPLTYAIRTDCADCAEEVWLEQVRNAGADTEQLAVVRLERKEGIFT